MGLANYIIKDGYFQIYYHDQVAPGNQPPTGNAASVAVARAKVDDVVAAAKHLKNIPWFKYYQGTWTEPALGGGKFTPLNLHPQGYMHGDAIYIKPIDQYAILAQSGDRSADANNWHKKLLITFSSDGIMWSDWQVVYTDGSTDHVYYPSLMSYGPDNEIAGSTFAAVYDYSPCHPRKACAAFYAVNVTVSSTAIIV